MKTILYTRTARPYPESTIEQERVCREYASKHGPTIVGTFHDTGDPQRSLEPLIATAARLEADSVLVRDVARLGRQPAKCQNSRETLHSAGLGVHVAESPTGDPQTAFELDLSLTIASAAAPTPGRRHPEH